MNVFSSGNWPCSQVIRITVHHTSVVQMASMLFSDLWRGVIVRFKYHQQVNHGGYVDVYKVNLSTNQMYIYSLKKVREI